MKTWEHPDYARDSVKHSVWTILWTIQQSWSVDNLAESALHFSELEHSTKLVARFGCKSMWIEGSCVSTIYDAHEDKNASMGRVLPLETALIHNAMCFHVFLLQIKLHRNPWVKYSLLFQLVPLCGERRLICLGWHNHNGISQNLGPDSLTLQQGLETAACRPY